ncbi:MAG: AMP-binding protein [Saprospiraceae bacterium]|jgi:fatty-acyl-CoA synthase|nr:AMP-binding protein [Saprospiraceae bacterium]
MHVHQTDWSARWSLYRPDHIAVEDGDTGHTLTYRQLNHCGNALAWYVQKEFDIQKGNRIVVLAENCLAYIGLFAAAQKLGFVLVPLNYRLTSPELAYMFRDSDPGLVIADKKYEHLLEEVDQRFKMNVITIDQVDTIMDEAVSCGAPPFLPAVFEESDPVFILYTSGTTGLPKGAIYTWQMLVWNSINTGMSLTIHSDSRTIQCMPPFHTGGWNVLLTPFLHHGAYVCIVRKFDAAHVLTLLQVKRATLFMAVPTMLRMIVEEPAFQAADFSHLLYLIVGGEPMPVPLIEVWDAKGVAVRQGYGLTEVGPNLTSLHQDDAIRKKGSIGHPNFYVDIRICNEAGEEVPQGERGELWIKGPMVTTGYWRDPSTSMEVLKDGWFRTGDIVTQDEERYIYIVDRLKNMFISGGENVYPAEIERVMIQHPEVAEVAVIAVSDQKWGEVGFAFVKANEGFNDQKNLLAWCSKHLAKYKVPKYVAFVEEIPKSDTGKINRRLLGTLTKENA